MNDTEHPMGGEDETDIAPAGPGTRSDHARPAPQAGSGASKTGPAPTSGADASDDASADETKTDMGAEGEDGEVYGG